MNIKTLHGLVLWVYYDETLCSYDAVILKNVQRDVLETLSNILLLEQ